MANRRVLLDSNVWRYIVDANAVPALLSTARRSRDIVVISPAVFHEAARTGDSSVRSRLLHAMTIRQWKRLLPEAYLEAQEILAEVRRLRPDWLKPAASLAWSNRVRHDWLRASGGHWDRVKNHPEVLAELEGSTMSLSRDESSFLRNQSVAWSPKWRDVPLTEPVGMPSEPMKGWNGVAVELWRFAALIAFRNSLGAREHHPYRDWLGGSVDLEVMLYQPEVLARFWLNEVSLTNMPRHWLRWAFEFLQRQYTVSSGTPVDAQIGCCLIDVDLLLSADKTMVRIAEKCRQDAPFAVAASVRVPSGPQCVEAVLEQLR